MWKEIVFFPRQHYISNFLECTGLNEGWERVESVNEFPVDRGTVITLRCEKKARQRHVLFGDKQITCQGGESFTRESGDEPNCVKLGKKVCPHIVE